MDFLPAQADFQRQLWPVMSFLKKKMKRGELAKISKFASGSSARSFFGPIGARDKETGEIYEVGERNVCNDSACTLTKKRK